MTQLGPKRQAQAQNRAPAGGAPEEEEVLPGGGDKDVTATVSNDASAGPQRGGMTVATCALVVALLGGVR